jgi:acetate kinase (EC 2.7.2.1)
MEKEGLTAEEVYTILNKKSGVLGLTDGFSSDMRDIETKHLR